MPMTTYIEECQFQNWQDFLDAELREEVSLANSTTTHSPWRIRARKKSRKEKWWHWHETAYTEYQVLYYLGGSEYQVMNIYDFRTWHDRSTVMAFFVGYNAVRSGERSETRWPAFS